MRSILLVGVLLAVGVGCDGEPEPSGDDSGGASDDTGTITAAPVADAGADQTVIPLGGVTLDGTGSDPNGGAAIDTWQWSLTTRPVGSQAALDDPSAAGPTFPADMAGVYEAELSVVNADGVPSENADVVRIDSSPLPRRIYIQLSWADTGDLDLHLTDAGAALFDVPGDTSWCNQNPDWAAAGDPTDDPSFLVDGTSAPGIEAISILSPAPNPAFIRVHYFGGCGGACAPVTARVEVFVDGVSTYFATQTLNDRNDVWLVGSVHIQEGVTPIDTMETTALNACP